MSEQTEATKENKEEVPTEAAPTEETTDNSSFEKTREEIEKTEPDHMDKTVGEHLDEA